MNKPSGKLAFAYATISNLEEKIARLEAAQPAPVAVVLPERKSDPEEPNDFDRYDLGEVSTFSEFRGVVEGWNACLDELKRLNPSL